MTVLGQFVGLPSRSIASVVDGDGTVARPWIFQFQSSDGGCTFVSIVEATSGYFDYLPILGGVGIPPQFNPNGGDLVTFRACEWKFQQFPGPPPNDGAHFQQMLVMGWVHYTLHYNGVLYPSTEPYAVLANPEQAGGYILAHHSELTPL